MGLTVYVAPYTVFPVCFPFSDKKENFLSSCSEKLAYSEYEYYYVTKMWSYSFWLDYWPLGFFLGSLFFFLIFIFCGGRTKVITMRFSIQAQKRKKR